ncbi:MAG: hypothetical protein AB1331_07645 [Bacillota bacterium]
MDAIGWSTLAGLALIFVVLRLILPSSRWTGIVLLGLLLASGLTVFIQICPVWIPSVARQVDWFPVALLVWAGSGVALVTGSALYARRRRLRTTDLAPAIGLAFLVATLLAPVATYFPVELRTIVHAGEWQNMSQVLPELPGQIVLARLFRVTGRSGLALVITRGDDDTSLSWFFNLKRNEEGWSLTEMRLVRVDGETNWGGLTLPPYFMEVEAKSVASGT